MDVWRIDQAMQRRTRRMRREERECVCEGEGKKERERETKGEEEREEDWHCTGRRARDPMGDGGKQVLEGCSFLRLVSTINAPIREGTDHSNTGNMLPVGGTDWECSHGDWHDTGIIPEYTGDSRAPGARRDGRDTEETSPPITSHPYTPVPIWAVCSSELLLWMDLR